MAGLSAGLFARERQQDRSPHAALPPAQSTDVADIPAVRIDAVVTDAQGRPIVDLRPTDFELLENGSARPVARVELRTLSRGAADDSPIETEADEKHAAQEPGTRVFAFFLDEFHVSPGASADRVRDGLARFVDEKLRPQDLAVVMKPLDPVTSIRFTRDRAVLHRAIAGFTGRKGNYAPRTPFEEQYMGRAPAAVIAARTQIVNASLRELTMRLGELKADRGVVVLVSEGFPRDSAGPRARIQELQGVVRASSRFHVAMYTFHPAAPSEDVARVDEREGAIATLQWLAAQTGGRAVQADEFAAGLARMAHDLEAYYALTYQPAKADGRFHAVEVRTKRRGAQVRARPGYWAPLGGEWRALLASSTTLTTPRRALRRSALIDAWVGLLLDRGGRARLTISWEPKPRVPVTPHLIVIRARSPKGMALFEGQVARVGAKSASSADSARFAVPTGRVELDLTILDAGGKVLDTDTRDVDVPDLASRNHGPVLLAPEVVRARTLREFHAASADPDAAPSSSRTFVRGDRLLIRVPAFDASGTAVRVTAKVLNGRGHAMRDIDATESAPLEGVTQFALPLSWLVPGEYLIELMGTNGNGAVRERVAFRLTG